MNVEAFTYECRGFHPSIEHDRLTDKKQTLDILITLLYNYKG